ncbi:MAG: hypothetical protein AABX03_04100 [Nanoarchaeota archaeon]
MNLSKITNSVKRTYLYSTGFEKAYLVFINLIRITLIIAIVSSILSQNWWILLTTILAFIMTFLPYIFEISYKINLPLEFEILTVVFIYASMFLGTVNNYYEIFWWWDLLLHAGSAIALGLFGFTILYVLHRANRLNAKPFLIAIFAFSFALAVGGLWEIFEFIIDQTLGWNMQGSGLRDTMGDLIVDSIGAFIASLLGYLYLKKRDFFILGRVMKRFIKQNPKLFEVENKDIDKKGKAKR